MAIEREPLRVRVGLEQVTPTVPVEMIEEGTPVVVTSGTFKGFIGRVAAPGYPDPPPFTVVVEED